jgi:tetratricopeptide (TPR) repeat protein
MAARIDFILMHRQWYQETDADPIKQMFVHYGDVDPEIRRALIAEQLAYVQPPPKDALLRIVQYDTCPAVRWDAASILVRSIEDDTDPFIKQVEAAVSEHPNNRDEYPIPGQNAALLAVDGWLYHNTNPPRAADLMERALAIEDANPSAYAGQMDFIFDFLSDRALTRKDYARAAILLRDEADRWPWLPQALAEPVANLFALHADFGPFPGFADDVGNYRGYFARPQMIYVLGRWLDREHHPLLAGLTNTAALVAGGTTLQSHFETAVFLVQQHWNATAERELNLCLTLPGGQVFGVYYYLSRVASDRDDEFTAGVDMETAANKLAGTGGFNGGDSKPGEIGPADYLAQAHWHYLRAARTAHDVEATREHLDKFLELDRQVHELLKDPGMAADIVPALQDLGRKPDADRIFADAYNALAAQIAAAPTEPMPKNNLAWLCACSGRHLDEAIRSATEAVAQIPDDPACMDTLAEAYFRAGNLAKALEIETRAVSLKPDDLYMERQMRKYQAAVEKH